MPSNDTPNRTNKRLLKGRLQSSTNEFVQEFTASISFDKRLYKEDIEGSIVYAMALKEAKVITQKDYSQIKKAFTKRKQNP